MFQIQIKDLIVYGKLGVFHQEKQLFAPFLIDLTCFLPKNHQIKELNDSVDYGALFSIIKDFFAKDYDLLETLCSDIVKKIRSTYPIIERVEISIFKINSGIAGIQGKVGVSFCG